MPGDVSGLFASLDDASADDIINENRIDSGVGDEMCDDLRVKVDGVATVKQSASAALAKGRTFDVGENGSTHGVIAAS